ncbi:MAG TPA: PfkB family carbohydrate kinase [Thermoanaerobaculia bacterium]|nr:PfkB family carbohydrate kinase [Thermoanaerobaculia bacterium]
MPEAPAPPTAERLLDLIGRMAGRPVVVLADLVVDRFVSGVPKRISREAPVLILRLESERVAPGGGANAVANIAALGGRPLPLGVVGDDASGRELLAELGARGIPTAGIRVRPGYRTPTKTRILGGAKGTIKQQIVRLDHEEILTLEEADRAHFREVLASAGAGAGGEPAVAVLSDYGYGTVETGLVAELRRALPSALLLLDSRYRLGEIRGVDGATPNEEEAEALYGGELEPAPSGDPQTLHRAGAELLARLGLRYLLITRGSRGMSLFLPGRSAHLPVHGSAQVADVTGAGDTVMGAFALAIAAGGSPLEAAALADYAGGVVVMKTGTATASREELEAAVAADPAPLEGLRWVES